jgi:endonuclease YncB( thermonuclease family)
MRAAETIPALYFDSSTGLLNADSEPLTDDSVVPVYAKEPARVVDQDGEGDAVSYGDNPIALVAADTEGGVYGFGCPFVTDDADFAYGNDEFLLTLWEEAMGEGTVLWDEGHDQYYDLSQFGDFQTYAEEHGFSVEATTDIEADIEGSAGVVITSPTGEFSDAEQEALSAFVEAGGSVFLHSQSDYNNFDETANLNTLCETLSAPFRFNDAQVMDDENNAGPSYVITTDRFTTDFPYFTDREGIGAGPRFAVDETYEATVEQVYDGDTVKVSVGEGTEDIRILGVDTPESSENGEAETPYEWPGLGGEPDDDYPTLASWGAEATAFAESELADETVTLSFDENEGISDPFGRLLCFIEYDADGSGSHDTLFDERLVEEGYARAFHSDLDMHDQLLRAELAARDADTGLWADSNPEESDSFRNEDVSELFVPRALTVGSQDDFADSDVLVRSAESADPAGAPLVAADTENRVAVTGGLLANDAYESAAGFEGDTSGYGNYPFLTNLMTALADKDGDVLIAGGSGHFGGSGTLTAEATSYFQRHLEGEGIDLNGVNDLANADDLLGDARAVVVTAPAEAYSQAALDALTSFRDDGGAVIVMGSAAASTEAAVNLNSVVSALGTDLQVGLTSVTDAETNVAGKSDLVATSEFEGSASLYTAFDGEASLRTPTPTATATDTDTATDGDGGETTETEGPGFGTLTGIAGVLGGAAYAARERLADD